MKIPYILYQYLIGFPLIVVVTLFTAIFTIVCFPWKNGKAPRAVQVFWSRSVLWLLLVPIKVTGKENVDPKQSYVFVANHQSFLDVFAVYGWLPNNFKWMMKKELRKIPFVGTACAVAGHIFVDRSNPRAALQSVELVKKELVDGISTVIFPEGTRTKNGARCIQNSHGFAPARSAHIISGFLRCDATQPLLCNTFFESAVAYRQTDRPITVCGHQ